jgi:3-oxoacyl-[acyl-carrier-protein] synthase-3
VTNRIILRAIGSYVPANFLSNAEFGSPDEPIDAAFLRDKVGIARVSRKAAAEETSDMCVKALADLRQSVPDLNVVHVDCLVVCTQNPDGHGIPHTSAIVHGKIGGGPRCAAFDLSLGCSGYVYGLSIIASFMEKNGFRRALFFTADPYSKIIDPADRNTAILFGDGATVTLLEQAGDADHAGAWSPSQFRFGTNGASGQALTNDSGRLQMNGRAVFTFSATVVPHQIEDLMKGCGLAAADVDRFVFHQGSKFIVDTLRTRLKLKPEQVPLMLEEQGNTVSSSIPLILKTLLYEPRHRRIVLSGFGVGLSWASCLLERGADGVH